MSKRMKRAALVMVTLAAFLTVTLYALSDSRSECVRRVARAVDLPLTKDTVVLEEYLKELSFNGDGVYFAVLQPATERDLLLQKVQTGERWHTVSASDEAFPDWIIAYVTEKSQEPRLLQSFKSAKFCRYRLINRLEGNAHLSNFTLAVMNMETGWILYVEYDS